MDLSNKDIEEITEKAAGTPFALFTSIDAGRSFKCHYSSLGEYSENYKVSIYQLKPLQRLIGKKLDLFTNGLQKELSEEDQRLAIILNWEGLERQLLILDLDTSTVSETMTSRIEDLKRVIQKKINC